MPLECYPHAKVRPSKLGAFVHGTVTLSLPIPVWLAESGPRIPPMGHLWMAASWVGLTLLTTGCLPTSPRATRTPPADTPTFTPTVPFPTAPPTITETPAPSLTPTPDIRESFGPQLYQTGFSSAEGWKLGRDTFGVTSLDEGQLSVVVNQPNSLRTLLSPVDPVGDFYAEVGIHTALCQAEDEFGLVFRDNPLDEHYRFTITCMGGLRLRRVLVGSSRAVLPFESFNQAVMPHAPADNTLGVLAQGADFELFVNGVSVLKAHDVALPVGRIGLIVSSGNGGQTTITFDSFSVWSLRQPTATPTPTVEPAGG